MKRLILTLLLLCAVPSLSHAQAIYLAPYEGDGTEENPFRANDKILGAGCKSLRSSESQRDGLGLCKGPHLPARAGVIDQKHTITKADRDALSADLKLTITAATFDGLIAELVDKQNISLGRKDGRQRIVLQGEEIWSRPAPLSSYLPDVWQVVKSIVAVPVAWAAATLTADFNCADDATSTFSCNGYTWTLRSGSAMQLLSNAFQSLNTVSPQVNINATELDSTDMLSRVVVSSISKGTATNVSGGAVVRHTNTTTSTYNYCTAFDGATDEIEMGHVTAGSRTADVNVAATVANGDTIEMMALGDQLSCKQNGVLVAGPITENNGSGNVHAGIRTSGSGTATTTTVILDDWYASVASTTTFGPLRRRGL